METTEAIVENAINVDKIERLLNLDALLNNYIVPFSLKLIIAIIIWIIGGLLVKAALRVVRKLLNTKHLEPTLVRYTLSALNVVLKGVVILIIMEICGIQTTSFAAIIGALGVAIGVAWSGLLSNIAAGVFLVVLRPFRVGDYITAAGQTGTVAEIGMFVTKMTTDNNILVHIGNNKLFSDIIINYSTNNTRRGDIRCQLAHEVDVDQAILLLLDKVKGIEGVLDNPAPVAVIAEFNNLGVALSVRFYALTSNYGNTYNAVYREIARTYAHAGWPAPAAVSVSRTGD